MQNIQNRYCIILENELKVGDHNSILMLGCAAQQQLCELSKAILNQLSNGNDNMIEYLIQNILKEIDEFQSLIDKTAIFHLGKNCNKRELLIKKYNAVLVYLDEMELVLKLQEAQVLKESKLFEEFDKNLIEVLVNFENIISYANEIIKHRQDKCNSKEIENWYERLSKKLEEIEISHTVALQCRAQIGLIQENNNQLIDRILTTVSNTIPIWRNQISILLGIECMNRSLRNQNKLAKIIYNSVINRKKVDRNIKEVSIEKLLETNEKLKKIICELDIMEKIDEDLKLKLSSSLR